MAFGAALGLPDLQGVYTASAAGRVILDATRGAFKIREEPGDNGLLMDFERADGTTVFATGFDGTRVTLGGLFEADIGVIGRSSIRVQLDGLNLLPQDRTMTVVPSDLGRIEFTSTLTLNFVNATFKAFLAVSGIVMNQQSGNPFGNGLLFNHSNNYRNAAAVAANFGPIFTLVDQATFTADGAAITMPQQNTIRSQPIFEGVSGGTLSLFAGVPHQQAIFITTYNAGVTVGAAGREAITVRAAIGTGTLTGPETGLRIANFTMGAGQRRGLWVETNSPGRAIDASGSGELRFGNAAATLNFFLGGPAGLQTIVGSRGANVALADLLTKLALYGLIVDGTVI